MFEATLVSLKEKRVEEKDEGTRSKAFFLFGTAGWRGDPRSGPVAPP